MALKASFPIIPITGVTSVSLKPSVAKFNGPPCTVRIQPLQSSFLGNRVRALQVTNSNRLRCNGLGGGSLGSETNLFSRFVRIIKSYANAILFYFEDPVKILDHAVDEMNQDLLTMRRTTAQVLASQKQLENKFEAARRASDHWKRRAQVALINKDENLALEALKRRKNFDDTAKSLKAHLDQLKSVVENIISKTRLLESKIHEAKSKKHVLKARATTAKAATKLRDMLDNVNGNSALSVFERMEEKKLTEYISSIILAVLTMESEAEMINQLTTNDLDAKFAMLEESSVYDDLEELKKDLPGSSTNGRELPPAMTVIAAGTGSPFRDVEIERQLPGMRQMIADF